MRFDIHHHPSDEMREQLTRIETMLDTLLERLENMSLDFAKLEAAVAAETTVTASAVSLLEHVAEALHNAAGDQEKVTALADKLQQQADALAAAVAANTPAATPPEQPAAA